MSIGPVICANNVLIKFVLKVQFFLLWRQFCHGGLMEYCHEELGLFRVYCHLGVELAWAVIVMGV